MSNPGEWITFTALCERVPSKSARTLRRYVAAGLLSHRQPGGKGGHLEFNWRTVERELQMLERHGTAADAIATMALGPETPPDLVELLTETRDLMRKIAARMGIARSESFAGEQRRTG